MPDTPESLGEIGRLLKGLREHNDGQFRQINNRLDNLVSVEVHQLYVSSMDRRLDDLAKMLADEREARVRADAAEAAERKQAIKDEVRERKAAADRQGTWVRWLTAAVLIPIVLWGATLFSNAGGGG
jgi:hypothetical protein